MRKEHGYRKIYQDVYGNIPEGWEIHHIDLNHSNDDPRNLLAMTKEDHKRLHTEISKLRVSHNECLKVCDVFRTGYQGFVKAGRISDLISCLEVCEELSYKYYPIRELSRLRKAGYVNVGDD